MYPLHQKATNRNPNFFPTEISNTPKTFLMNQVSKFSKSMNFYI